MIIASSTTDEQIKELHLWAVREGLRRAPAAPLFEEFCRRLVAFGVPLWRGFAGMRTLHPQWAGFTYTWWRDRDLQPPARTPQGRVDRASDTCASTGAFYCGPDNKNRL